MVDEGSRCPFLLENDDSKLVTCMCNYYSLGQAELARALLRIVASRSLARALRIVKTIIWHGPPKHWLCSVFAPSSAHVTWMCLIDFQDLVETHMKRPAQLPPWLLKRLEFDVLIAQALLDGAAIQAQALTAEVASELRAYHAGLLCATGQEEDLPPEMQVPYSFKLPALSLLQVTNQVSPYVNFLPAHTTDRHEQVDHLASGNASLSKAAVQQLYDLCKSQPLLGRCVGRALAPPGCAAALTTARRIQQMCLGLTADSLLQSLKGDAWRYLKFLEVSDAIGSPQPLLELFSVLLVVVVSDIRPTPALHARLQGLVSMATSTLSATAATGAGPSVAADSGASVVGNLASAVVGSGVVGTGAVGAGVGPGTLGGPSAPPGTLGAQEAGGGPPEGGEGDGGAPATGPDGPHLGAQAGPAGVAVTGSTAGASTAAAARTLAEIFAQALPAEGGTGTKPWEHLRQLLAARTRGAAEEAYGAAGAGGGAAARSSAHRFSKFLNRIRGEKSIEDDALQEDLGAAPRGSDGGRHQFHSEGANGAEGGGGQPGGVAWQAAGDRPRAKAELSAVSVGGADGWDADGPAEAARNAFLHRTQIYEALLTHESGAGGTQTALRLFSVLEDELLRLKAAQSPLPPAFELLEPSDADAYLFKAPPITFWDAYFEFVRVAGVHCLEYVVHAAVKFIRQHDFCAAAWLLAPFPQLKPLVVLLCWPEFDGDVGSRQSLLDTLWKSYTEETREDPSRTGDQLVDHWVEVLNYRLSVSWWISKLKEDSRSAQGQAELEKLPGYRASAHERGGGPGARRKEPAPPSAGVGAAQEQGSEPDARPLALVAADVLNRVKSHSILYVMRPDLPMVESHTLLSALQSLPPLRQAAAAMEHSYDLDLARCYYTVRCATYLVERCVPAAGAKAVSFDSVMPGRQVIEEGMNELNRLISSIERTPLKVSIFLIISSLCFMRRRYLQHDGTMRGSAAAAQPPPSGAEAASDFLVPPGVMLSLLALLRHHLQALVAQEGTSDGLPEASAEQLRGIIRNLFQFTQETIWRIFITLRSPRTSSPTPSSPPRRAPCSCGRRGGRASRPSRRTTPRSGRTRSAP
ncbi:unnamed protein product [Prorocentrum cordatum]|uniref:Uncharacterized protein n=1 Tax=Prorocentrum cordatum TaxID=2364126 RepID=A0ABN9QSH3_9DINO|nr:unnamed protein product [Polarella glacialis]